MLCSDDDVTEGGAVTVTGGSTSRVGGGCWAGAAPAQHETARMDAIGTERRRLTTGEPLIPCGHDAGKRRGVGAVGRRGAGPPRRDFESAADDLRLHPSEGGEELALLLGRDLELVERLDQVLDERGELRVGDV